MADEVKKDAANNAKKHESQFMAMGTEKFNHELLALVRSRQPLIYIATNEESRFLFYIRNFCVAREMQGYIWDCYKGLMNVTDMKKAEIAGDESSDVDAILDLIINNINEAESATHKKKNDKGTIFILLGFDRFLKNPTCSPDTERRLKCIVRDAKKVSVILTGPSFASTPSLDKDISILDFPYPNESELKNVLWDVVESVAGSFPGLKEEVEKSEEELINSVKGMTIAEAQLAFSKSLVMSKPLGHKPLDKSKIIQEKRQIIRKSGILEYFDTDITIKDVGGLEPLVDWIKLRKLAFTHDARNYGLDTPRGILLIGHPGSGKSLSAKAAASEYNIPLLRLDFGRLFGSLVGDSERNARDAISLAEAIAPCVSGSSVVYDSKGNAHVLSELIKDDSPVKENFYIYALNEQSNRLEKTLVTKILRKPQKEMIRFVTDAGSVEVTKDHKMLRVNDGKTEWVEAKSLKPGNYLVTPNKFIREAEDISLSKLLPKKTKSSESFIFSLEDDEIHLDKDFDPVSIYYIIGMLDVYGTLSPGKIVFNANNVQIAHHFCRSIQSVFGVEPVVIGSSALIANKLVCRILIKASKTLLTQNDACLEKYLSGYLDIYGYIKPNDRHPKIVLPIDSIEQLPRCSTIKTRLRKSLNALGIINVQELDAVIFIDDIDEIKKLKPLLDVSNLDHKGDLSSICFRPTETCAKTVNSNYIRIGSNRKQDANVIVHAQEDILGVKILAIEDAGIQWCYDLACEENHNFFANDICCHNCILWTDELEKGLSGSRSSGDTDGGTTSRVISTFLTWLQEKTAPVFVIATANNVEDIPPEFMRAGRFDECFFVGLPGKTGRKQIFDILIRKKNRKSGSFNIDKLVESTDGYSGAEIEKVISTALFKSYSENKREVTTDDILDAISNFSPLSTTREEEFKKREEWAKGRCIMANTIDGINLKVDNMKKDISIET